MQTRPTPASLVPALSLALLLPLAACDRSESVAAQQARANRVAAQQQQQQIPTTPMEIAKDAYGKGDQIKALQNFLIAAKDGDKDAQYYVGVMFAEGQGTKKNLAEGIGWYQAAAQQNQPDALLALARLYVVGYGLPQDSQKAIELMDRAVQAYPPGEGKDRATEQKLALSAVLEEQRNPPPQKK